MSLLLPRRRFLGSSLVALGATLLDALATPLWKWNRQAIVEATTLPSTPASPVIFVDVAREAGLTIPNVWGGLAHKQFIVEAKGAALRSSTTMGTAGSIFILRTDPGLTQNGPPGWHPRLTSTRTIGTALSLTSRNTRESAGRAGKWECVSAIMTTMATWTF